MNVNFVPEKRQRRGSLGTMNVVLKNEKLSLLL